MAKTYNELYMDALLRRAIYVERLKKGEARELLILLTATQGDLRERMERSLASMRHGRERRESRRLAQLMGFTEGLRQEAWGAVSGELTEKLTEIAALEAATEAATFASVFPVEVELGVPAAAQIRAAIADTPFLGKTLSEHLKGLGSLDVGRIQGQIRMGFINGEDTPTIVSRVFGTAELGFRDGALATTARQLESLSRTAIHHAAVTAREEMWLDNQDIIEGLRFTATLDGRTTPICRALDGTLYFWSGTAWVDAKGSPRPILPIHFNERSLYVASVDGVGIVGDRPFVRDTRGRREREVNFRDEARREAGAGWAGMSARDRNAAVRAERTRWAQENIGTVPAKTTYQEWLRAQPPGFQRDVLGPTRYKLFRDGGLTLDRFVDQKHKQITLANLRQIEPEAFVKAGL